MNFNWPIIGDKIFGIIKGSGFKLQMFDKAGAKTLDPHEATRFFATTSSNDPELKEYSILISVHDENADSHLDIKTPTLKDEKDFEFIRKIRDSLQRNVGDREGLSINWFKFDHNIRPKDDAMNNITESDISKPFGSTKSSYQKVGEAKLIIRHTDIVDESKIGSRWRHVKAIFIETRIGERLLYPHMHIAGARAMARHLNSGSFNDEIAESIKSLSHDYMALKESARMLRRVGDESQTTTLRESLHGINKKVKRLAGPRGYTALSDSLRERVIAEENEQISSIHADLMERCGCASDSDSAMPLMVAARYLSNAGKNIDSDDYEIGFTRQPDLVTGAADHTDHKSRLAWQIDELAECVDDHDIRDQLKDISVVLRDRGIVDPKDMDLIRMVFKASKGIQHQPEITEDAGLVRIRELSGL